MRLFALIALLLTFNVQAELIGKVHTSGIFFKDSISIESFSDPTLDGVACHVSSPNRALSFEDQTNSSISCRQVKSRITGEYTQPAKNIFSKRKSFFFKTMTVDRFYDEKNNTLVYIAYTKKASGDNASHSLSTVPLWSAQ